MSAKRSNENENKPVRAKISFPGRPTPTYQDGGYFTVRSAPVTINATKDQILKVLLRLDAYHTWNNFVPAVSDIVPPAEPAPGPSEPQDDPNMITAIGTSFTFHVRMLPALPFWKIPSVEVLTTISKTENVYMVSWRCPDVNAERVHVITEGADGYGTCKYESYETFQRNVTTTLTLWIFGIALKSRFDEWSTDLKKAVEGHNW